MSSGFRLWWGSKTLTLVIADSGVEFIVDDEGEITLAETETELDGPIPMGFAPALPRNADTVTPP